MKLCLRLVAAVCLTAWPVWAGSPKYKFVYASPTAIPGEFAGKKIAAFVILPDEGLRKGREETLAEELRQRGLDCYAGYIAVPGLMEKNRAQAREILQKKGYHGAVLMRLLGDEEVARSSISVGVGWYDQPYYSGFMGYWDYGWSSVYSVGYTWKDRVITLETLIYSLDRNQLVWAGRSEATNPKDIRKFVSELVQETSKQLQKAGLINK